MKINWGTGIFIAFVLFISFILFFVVRMTTNKKFEHDLVTEEYYKQELGFQDQLEDEKRSKDHGYNPEVIKTDEGLRLTFPKTETGKVINGKILMYRPSNKKLDFTTDFSTENSSYLIPEPERLVEGRWNIIVSWQYEDESYYFKKEIIL